MSLASVSANVPILSCGGISKRYMVPGWRLGWIIMYDRNEAFKTEIAPGLLRLAMKLLGPCTLIQAALPHILRSTPQEYHDGNIAILQRNAELVYEGLKGVPGLDPVMPAGAMYMMVSLRGVGGRVPGLDPVMPARGGGGGGGGHVHDGESEGGGVPWSGLSS